MTYKQVIVKAETHKLLVKMKRKGFSSFNEIIFYCLKICEDSTKGQIVRLSEIEAKRISPKEFEERFKPIPIKSTDMFSAKLEKEADKIE